MLPRVWLVTDRRRARRPLPEAVALALQGFPRGLAGVLLREKDLDGRSLVTLARTLRSITHEAGAPLVVSGRLDVALASGADGVHLGGEAPPFEAVRAIAPEGFLVGVSLHQREQPPEGASYAFLSPVFPTRSKPGAPTLGLDGLADGCRRAHPVPVYALGGIDTTNARACIEAGAFGIAVLGAVLTDVDPRARAAELADALVLS